MKINIPDVEINESLKIKEQRLKVMLEIIKLYDFVIEFCKRGINDTKKR